MIFVVLKAEDVYPVDELIADLFPVLAVHSGFILASICILKVS